MFRPARDDAQEHRVLSNVLPKNKVSLFSVDKQDRAMVKKIILGITRFQEPASNLGIDIFATADHYNITFSNWDQPIDDAKWYNMFLKEEGLDRRDTAYDCIISTETTICPDTEGGSAKPVKLGRVRRSPGGFNQRKQRK